MSQEVILTKVWKKIDTSKADVLITGEYELFLGGSTVPAADAKGHMLKQPILIPMGVGVYIRSKFSNNETTLTATVIVSAMNKASEAATNPIS